MNKVARTLLLILCTCTCFNMRGGEEDYRVISEHEMGGDGVFHTETLENGITCTFSNVKLKYRIDQLFGIIGCEGTLSMDISFSGPLERAFFHYVGGKWEIESEWNPIHKLVYPNNSENGIVHLEFGIHDEFRWRVGTLRTGVKDNWCHTKQFFVTDMMLPEHLKYFKNSVDAPNADSMPEINLMYPNLRINGLQSNTNISVYDITGRKIIDNTIDASGASTEIDCSHLERGIYIVIVKTGSQTYKKKIAIP